MLAKSFMYSSKLKEIPMTLDYNKKKGKSKMKLMPTMKRYVNVLTKIKKWKR